VETDSSRRNFLVALTLALLAGGATSAVIASPEGAPGQAAPGAETQSALPGNGPAQHPFLYAGEWDTRKPLEQSIFIVRGGKVVWQYSIPLRTPTDRIQEFDDATLLSNGNIIFSRVSGAGEVNPRKELVWNYEAPPGDLDR
jgi:hypothetical protein